MRKGRRGYRRMWTKCGGKGSRPWKTTIAVADSTSPAHEPKESIAFEGFDVPALRPSIRILSVFDGISSLLVAADKLQMKVDLYASSEVDPSAIRLQKHRHGSRIVQIGPIQSITEDVLDKLAPIHLLCGGSPCQQISLANPKRLNLDDPESSANLYKYFVKIRDYLSEQAQRNNHYFNFIFENSFSIENSVRDKFSMELGISPIQICASSFLDVRRRRYFWTDISGILDQPLPERESLADILSYGRVPNDQIKILPTLTSTLHSQLTGPNKIRPVLQDGCDGCLYSSERERAFGLVEGYTDGCGLTQGTRRRLLGNSFVVNVIEHILRPISPLYRNIADYIT